MNSFIRTPRVVAVWMTIGMILVLSKSSTAQVDCVFKKIHVSSLHGTVTDQVGEVIPDAIVSLRHGKELAAETRTDANGNFAIRGVSGDYELTVEIKGFHSAWSPIQIGPSVKSLFYSSSLRIMLLVGVDQCEKFTTSKKEFDRTVAANKQLLKEAIENHATQK